jgi:hypothetical protein
VKRRVWKGRASRNGGTDEGRVMSDDGRGARQILTTKEHECGGSPARGPGLRAGGPPLGGEEVGLFVGCFGEAPGLERQGLTQRRDG